MALGKWPGCAWRRRGCADHRGHGRFSFNKELAFTAGVKNLLDEKPPLSIKIVADKMMGFDPRYADGKRRTFYLSGSYRF